MPFDIDSQLADLWQSVNDMASTEEARPFTWDKQSVTSRKDPQTDRAFDTALCRGLEVSWEDVDVKNGLFTFRDVPVMFSPDNGGTLHLKQCQLLKEMKPNSIGSVHAWFRSGNQGEESPRLSEESESVAGGAPEKPEICLHCLYELNYLGFYYGTRERRELIRDEFTFDRFVSDNGASYFSHNSSVAVFDHPEQLIKWYSPQNQFETGELQCSEECAHCTVKLASWQLNSSLAIAALLHAESVGTRVGQGGSENSEVSESTTHLCWDCYKRQNDDLGLCLPYEVIEAINKQRRSQGLLQDRGWPQLKQFSDSAYHGLLDHLQRNIGVAPELFYPIKLNNGETACLLYAWPETRKAITPLANDLQEYTDWALWDVADTLASFSSR